MVYKKICLLGDFAVGKTSLVRRFVDRQFSDKYLSTIGVKISRKQVDLSAQDSENSKSVQLMIWDIEGHTRFKEIAPSYLQGASGAIIVADLTRHDTMERLSKHIDLFLSVNSKSVMIIAFNKCDLVDSSQITQRIKKATSFHCDQIISIYQTSAKSGMNVDNMFINLSQQLVN